MKCAGLLPGTACVLALTLCGCFTGDKATPPPSTDAITQGVALSTDVLSVEQAIDQMRMRMMTAYLNGKEVPLMRSVHTEINKAYSKIAKDFYFGAVRDGEIRDFRISRPRMENEPVYVLQQQISFTVMEYKNNTPALRWEVFIMKPRLVRDDAKYEQLCLTLDADKFKRLPPEEREQYLWSSGPIYIQWDQDKVNEESVYANEIETVHPLIKPLQTTP